MNQVARDLIRFTDESGYLDRAGFESVHPMSESLLHTLEMLEKHGLVLTDRDGTGTIVDYEPSSRLLKLR